LLLRKKRENHRKKKKELPVSHIPTHKSHSVNEFIFNKKKYNRNGLVVEWCWKKLYWDFFIWFLVFKRVTLCFGPENSIIEESKNFFWYFQLILLNLTRVISWSSWSGLIQNNFILIFFLKVNKKLFGRKQIESFDQVNRINSNFFILTKVGLEGHQVDLLGQVGFNNNIYWWNRLKFGF